MLCLSGTLCGAAIGAAAAAGAAAAIVFSLRAIDAGRRSHGARLAADGARRDALAAELRQLDADDDRIREREHALAHIYEITRKMSGSMTFDDIFSVFSAFLNENLSYATCDLLILDSDGAELRLGRRYRVLKDPAPPAAADKTVDYSRLIASFARQPREVAIVRDEDPRAFEDLGIQDPGVATFVGVPLVHEKRLAAILALTNLPKEDFEKTLILSMQFALEIQKVLLYETVERLSITDSLTGLYMRRHFMERFEEEVERSRSHGLTCAFLMIDIDDFKKCNDTYGHLVGDVVLREAARLMRENVREIDLVCRYGGEEFAVILPETGPEGAKHAAERIRKRIAEHTFRAYDEKLSVTISAGVALFPADADRAAQLVEKADQALYRAKWNGKNVVCVYKK